MKISVITPTCRPEGLPIVAKCLKRQDLQDFEWVIVSPDNLHLEIDRQIGHDYDFILLSDPPKNEGDFWSLCKAWNLAYSKAKGELIINIQDWLYFPPNTLSAFWGHYTASPKNLVTAVGDQYARIDERGVPQDLVWQDPRKRSDNGTFYKCTPSDMEMAMCSIPKQAILDCGGTDEEYDKGPGIQEKEMCFRLLALGYETCIDQSIEYKAFQHGRLTTDWDDKYWSVTAPMFKRHMNDLLEKKRPLNVGYVK